MSTKRIMTLFLLLFVFNSWALTTQQAFQQFYNDNQISSNHCGINTQLFIKYLNDMGVQYKEGYVVSIHEDFGALNHFDARWGNLARYENGEQYYRSNWYFHVFAVIDGIAYDFSQAGAKAQSLNDYLSTSYIPKSRTENIFFLGHFDKEKAFKKYLNMDMKIYDLTDYANEMGPVKYNGSFIELFKNNIKSTSQFDSSLISDKLSYSSLVKNQDQYIIENPSILVDDNFIGILAYEKKICQAFGFMGAFPTQTELNITDKEPAVYLYSSMNTKTPVNFDPQLSLMFSHNLRETMGSIQRKYFHHASRVVCGDLASIIKH